MLSRVIIAQHMFRHQPQEPEEPFSFAAEFYSEVGIDYSLVSYLGRDDTFGQADPVDHINYRDKSLQLVLGKLTVTSDVNTTL